MVPKLTSARECIKYLFSIDAYDVHKMLVYIYVHLLVSVPCLYLSFMSIKKRSERFVLSSALWYGVRLLTLQNSVLLLPSSGYKWRWRQQSWKQWYPSTRLHVVINSRLQYGGKKLINSSIMQQPLTVANHDMDVRSSGRVQSVVLYCSVTTDLRIRICHWPL